MADVVGKMYEQEVAHLAQQMDVLLAENKRLKAERDTWRSRAMVMFWRLPDDTKIGELRAEAETAELFF